MATRVASRRSVGATDLVVRVSNPREPERVEELEMLVDSGATWALLPAAVLGRLGIRPERTETFSLADRRNVRRDVGTARFEVAGRTAASTVIFGRRGDACLLGVVTLEALGLVLDPFRRELRPMRLRFG